MAARKVKIKMVTTRKGDGIYIVQARPGGSSRQTSWMTLSSKTHPDALKGMPVFRNESGRREAEKTVRLMRTFGPDWSDAEYRVVLKSMVTPARDRGRDCGCSHSPTKKVAKKAARDCGCAHSGKENRMTPSRDITLRRPTKRRAPRKVRKGARRDTQAQKTCGLSTEVQALLLSRQFFTEKEATSWIRRHGFRISKIDATENNWRFRQHPPSSFEAESFRTIRFRPGVEAVIGCPKNS